jgi:hypothetical protein
VKLAIGEQSLRSFIAQRAAAVPRRRVPNTAKAARTRSDVRFEHGRHSIAQSEVGVSDNSRHDSRVNRWIVRGSLSDAFEKCGFTDGLEFLRTGLSIPIATLDRNRRSDIVTTVEIVEQILQQIIFRMPLPQMMMRIADRQRGLERGLGGNLCLFVFSRHRLILFPIESAMRAAERGESRAS